MDECNLQIRAVTILNMQLESLHKKIKDSFDSRDTHLDCVSKSSPETFTRQGCKLMYAEHLSLSHMIKFFRYHFAHHTGQPDYRLRLWKKLARNNYLSKKQP